ncbi:MFS transporter [Streptomyces sp. DSM 44917]|uniref:MFS transporter n=1 Tax=Streptomyces boetiae TaxID=3075541 RepID=A0ABU2LE71_9ACTN|nr:MFS transporter [Streptomyces sp. DSM 44917]MDT0309791.1 MFS transporter [Streptomyces sp. DSM 44917]
MSSSAPRRELNPWYIAVVAGMASYLDAAVIVSTGTSLVLYEDPLGLTGDEIGVLSFALTLGLAIGSVTGGRLGDRFGRKPVFGVTMLGIAVAMALNVCATGFPMLLAGAILGGLSSGADLPVSIATIAEAANDENRGKMVSFSQVLWTVGIVIPLVLAVAFGGLDRLGGQISFGHIGVIALLVLACRVGLPESPVWLAARAERQREGGAARTERVPIRALLKGTYAVPFVCLLLFYPLVNLAGNTSGQFGTYLWVNVADSTVEFSSLIGLIGLTLALLFAVLFMRVVDTRYRMPVFYAGAACYVLSHLTPTVFGVSAATLAVWQLLLAIANSIAFEAVFKVWAQESFPTLLRATAQGTIIAVARLLAAVLALVTPRLAAAGPQGLFAMLTALVVIGMAAAIIGFRNHTNNEFPTHANPTEPARAH